MPVAVVQDGTLSTQRSVVSQLDQVVDAVASVGLVSPALVVVGRSRTVCSKQGSSGSIKEISMKRMKLVMIGNGMAGVRTLEEILRISPSLYDITVFGAEPQANYNRILLSPVLAGEMTLKEIMLNDVDWYEKNGITLHLKKKIIRIDRVNAQGDC
jgi:hypothetical protein